MLTLRAHSDFLWRLEAEFLGITEVQFFSGVPFVICAQRKPAENDFSEILILWFSPQKREHNSDERTNQISK